jgi:1-deoxy-D-xylulose-5-phosphate reductoisomerase
VAAFLDGRCRFVDIPRTIAGALEAHAGAKADDLEACLAVDAQARRWTEAAVRS